MTTATPFPDALEALAQAAPDRPALTVGGETLSRRQFVEQAGNLARALAERGVVKDDVVSIVLPNSVDLVLALFATLWVGATPQPLSDRLPSAERDAILDLAQPALVVGDNGSYAGPTLARADIRAAAAQTGAAPPVAVADVWKIVTSGGSTGRPKLIKATQPAVVESVAGLGALLRFPRDGVVLITGPLSHNAPLVATVVGLLFGDHMVVMERFDAAETLALIERHRVQWLYLVPTMMSRIWRLPEDVRAAADLSSVEVAFHMAAPCPEWLKRAWINWLGPEVVLELYGGTELQALTVVTGTEWLEHAGSVGRPVIGEMEIRDGDGNPVPAGQAGEVWMRRGPGIPPPYTYVGAEAKTAAEGWESLGDLGWMDADGYLYLNDRLTDMIVVGGSNVYPAEVEAALDEHPAVRTSCVIGLPDEDLGNRIHALVDVVGEVSDDDLRSFVREKLAPYKVPKTFERVTEPLRDDAGKVRRSALRHARL